MTDGPAEIRRICDRVLAAVVSAYSAAGVELPARRYIAPGHPSQIDWDDEQVTVQVAQLYVGQPGQPLTPPQLTPGRPVGHGRTLALEIQVVRRTAALTDEGIPTVDDLAASGAATVTDLAVLFDALADALTDGTITDLPTQALVGPGVPIGPLGDLAGVGVTVAIAL